MKKLLIIFVIIFSSRVYAQSALSTGHLNCGDFLSACDSSLLDLNCQVQTGWAMGFISGANSGDTGGKRQVGVKDDGVVSKDTIKHALIKFPISLA